MIISYLIKNNEELKELEELGTLKNEIEKERLLKKQGKQKQDYLLEKQFKPITKAIKENSPEKRLEAAQKEQIENQEEQEEQEILNEMKKDYQTRMNVHPDINDLIKALRNSRHKQNKLIHE